MYMGCFAEGLSHIHTGPKIEALTHPQERTHPRSLALLGGVPTDGRKGSTDTYCYGFADDGPHANTVLGAVWMMHQESFHLAL